MFEKYAKRFGKQLPEEIREDSNSETRSFEWEEIFLIAFSLLRLDPDKFWNLSWSQFYYMYNGFIQQKMYEYSCISNVHTKKPMRFDKLFSQSFGDIHFNRNRSTSSKEEFMMTAKRFNLKMPGSSKELKKVTSKQQNINL